MCSSDLAQWDGRPLDCKLAVIAAPDDAWQPTSDGPDWGPPFADAYFTGPRAFLDAGARVEAQVAWLRDNESDLLATTPSNLAAIVEHLGTNNTALPRLRYVRTSGRPAAQQLHRASADLWGARLHDGYVDPILGAIAYPCPERGRYHVHAERVVVDVVDDAGRPCPAGRLGRIVVTPLHWFSMPAVRLDTGDLGALVDGCDCGRGLPTLIGVDRPLSQK